MLLMTVQMCGHTELFQLDESGQPTAAGCPPDGFSATGQLWGILYIGGIITKKPDFPSG